MNNFNNIPILNREVDLLNKKFNAVHFKHKHIPI